MARMGEKAENVKSFISQINNLSSAMEKNKMNSHKTYIPQVATINRVITLNYTRDSAVVFCVRSSDCMFVCIPTLGIACAEGRVKPHNPCSIKANS